MRRTVGHVFDFGARPEPAEASDLAADTMTLEGILHPHDLTRAVLHPTTYFRSGWGTRPLTADELGIAFGFPGWLRFGGLEVSMFPIVPLQIMDACIRQVLDTRGFVSPLIPATIEPPRVAADATWLPGIRRFLPHSWIPVSVITDKAVKHDDAAVHTAMWDNLFTLLYDWSLPRSAHLLDLFRRRLMLSYRARLTGELHRYLADTHGLSWTRRLLSCRGQELSLAGRK